MGELRATKEQITDRHRDMHTEIKQLCDKSEEGLGIYREQKERERSRCRAGIGWNTAGRHRECTYMVI